MPERAEGGPGSEDYRFPERGRGRRDSRRGGRREAGPRVVPETIAEMEQREHRARMQARDAADVAGREKDATDSSYSTGVDVVELPEGKKQLSVMWRGGGGVNIDIRDAVIASRVDLVPGKEIKASSNKAREVSVPEKGVSKDDVAPLLREIIRAKLYDHIQVARARKTALDFEALKLDLKKNYSTRSQSEIARMYIDSESEAAEAKRIEEELITEILVQELERFEKEENIDLLILVGGKDAYKRKFERPAEVPQKDPKDRTKAERKAAKKEVKKREREIIKDVLGYGTAAGALYFGGGVVGSLLMGVYGVVYKAGETITKLIRGSYNLLQKEASRAMFWKKWEMEGEKKEEKEK